MERKELVTEFRETIWVLGWLLFPLTGNILDCGARANQDAAYLMHRCSQQPQQRVGNAKS